MQRSAIILCGGKSKRIGADKASLPFGEGQTLLSSVVSCAAEFVDGGPIVCVASAGQQLPELPTGVEVATDRRPDRGPLEALATGLKALQSRADAAVALGCDTPLLVPAVAELLFERLVPRVQAVVPVVEDHWQTLLAAYRVDAAPLADETISAGQGSLHAFLDRLSVREVNEEEIRSIDPDLRSFLNCNTRAAYDQALRVAREPPADSQ